MDYPVLRDGALAEFEQIAREHDEAPDFHDADAVPDADYGEPRQG